MRLEAFLYSIYIYIYIYIQYKLEGANASLSIISKLVESLHVHYTTQGLEHHFYLFIYF